MSPPEGGAEPRIRIEVWQQIDGEPCVVVMELSFVAWESARISIADAAIKEALAELGEHGRRRNAFRRGKSW